MPAPSLLWFRVEGNKFIINFCIDTLYSSANLCTSNNKTGENYQLIHSSTANKVNALKDGSLQFAKIAKSDQGLYACRATNNIGNSLSKTIRVNVNGDTMLSSNSSIDVFFFNRS
jgi:hypothetical protein